MAFTTALVTGASSGIGYEISRQLAKEGHNLVLVARRRERLEELASRLRNDAPCKVTVIAIDLAQPGAPETLYRQLKQDNIPVDILVNNAGVGTRGSFLKIPTERELAELQLNVVALTHLCKLFGNDMVQRGLGKILNIASVAAFLPGPYMSVYNASKAYVLSFSEALRQELKGSGISVTVVCPGPVQSEFHQIANTQSVKFLQIAPMMTSAELAQHALKAMHDRRAVAVPGIFNRLTSLLPRLLPRNWVAFIVRLIMKP